MSAQAVAFAAPGDAELAPNPINPDWIIEGNAQARAKRLAESADGTSSVMAWSCTPGRFEWHYEVDETVHIISGEVLVTDEKGAIHRLGPGDMAFFPAGSHSVWQVTKPVRKLAVCRHSSPRRLKGSPGNLTELQDCQRNRWIICTFRNPFTALASVGYVSQTLAKEGGYAQAKGPDR
jgi:uncharacterized cupin superfamily protein